MTLKIRLAAMMVFLLIAVMALQYILTQREQAELRRQIAHASAQVNSSAREVSYWVGALAAEGETDLSGRLMEEFGDRRSPDEGENEVTVRIVHERSGPGGLYFAEEVRRVSGTDRRVERLSTGAETPDSIAVLIVDETFDHDSLRAVMAAEVQAGSTRHRYITNLSGRTVIRTETWESDSDTVIAADIHVGAYPGRDRHPDHDSIPGRLAQLITATVADSGRHDLSFMLPLPRFTGTDSLQLVEISYPTAELTDALAASKRRSVLWLASLLGVGVIGAAIMAGRFTRPIRTLERSFKRVEDGDLDVTLDSRGDDEVGRLTASFNHMVGRLRESKAMEARLAESERLAATGRLAAGVAHEVRNPLNAIQLTMQQMRDKAAPPPDSPERAAFERYHRTVSTEVDRLEHLVSAFLDLSRSEALVRERVDLTERLRDAVELFKPDAEARGVDIALEAEPGLEVIADPARLPMVWSNLLANALAATSEGGRIVVAAAREEDGVRMSVTDDGAGIPADVLPRIWDPFFSGRPEGTGLGLSIVRSVVERHGGRVLAESDPGSGTVMTVWIPATPPPNGEDTA